MCAQLLSHVWFCDPVDLSPPGSSFCGISQARILEWVASSLSRGSSWFRDKTQVSCIGRQVLYCWATREAPDNRTGKCKYSQNCEVLVTIVSDSAIPWTVARQGPLVRARILEWVAISFSKNCKGDTQIIKTWKTLQKTKDGGLCSLF